VLPQKIFNVPEWPGQYAGFLGSERDAWHVLGNPESPEFKIDDLNLPPQVEKLADFHRGIVIVSGTTGSGKSTSLAAIIGKINRTRSERIITVEDPVEYQHENAKSLVSQVEVGTDSESYEHALRAMMRQDPDTILVGEIRDTFSLSTAKPSVSQRGTRPSVLAICRTCANSCFSTRPQLKAPIFSPARGDDATISRPKVTANVSSPGMPETRTENRWLSG